MYFGPHQSPAANPFVQAAAAAFGSTELRRQTAKGADRELNRKRVMKDEIAKQARLQTTTALEAQKDFFA